MSKKMIEPEKSYFVKVPSRLADIIQKSGLAGTNVPSTPARDGSEMTPQTAQNELPTG